MVDLVTQALRDPNRFEQVKPARWRSVSSGIQVETNYVYGEGTVRVYEGASSRPVDVIKVRGGRGDRDLLRTVLDLVESGTRNVRPVLPTG